MTISPQRMLKLGCSKNHIKFFVKQEFENETDFLDNYFEFCNSKQSNDLESSVIETFLDYLIRLRNSDKNFIPGHIVDGVYIQMSNSHLKRLLDSKSIRINGIFPDSKTPLDDIVFPIWDWVWFPKSRYKITFF